MAGEPEAGRVLGSEVTFPTCGDVTCLLTSNPGAMCRECYGKLCAHLSAKAERERIADYIDAEAKQAGAPEGRLLMQSTARDIRKGDHHG